MADVAAAVVYIADEWAECCGSMRADWNCATRAVQTEMRDERSRARRRSEGRRRRERYKGESER
jgi:hypothetical protein